MHKHNLIVVLKSHTIKGQRCDVKKALPREDTESGRGGGRGGMHHN